MTQAHVLSLGTLSITPASVARTLASLRGDQQGLMASLSIEGTKISRIKR